MSWPGQASEHDANHGKTDKSGRGSRISLEVSREAAIMADPRQGSLDDPAFRHDDEAMEFVALDDLQFPGAGLGNRRGCLRSLVAGIGEDAVDEREEAAGALIEHEPRTIAILYVSGVDNHVQQETERIDEDVPLATRDLLARIKALRVERGAPF